MRIGAALKKERERQGRTQAEVAIKAGMRPNTLVDLETKDKSPRIKTVEKVAEALGRSMSYLYGFAEGTPKEGPPVTLLSHRDFVVHSKVAQILKSGSERQRDALMYAIDGVFLSLPEEDQHYPGPTSSQYVIVPDPPPQKPPLRDKGTLK